MQGRLDNSDELVLLVDSSKFQGSGNVLCELNEVDIFVADPGITNRDKAMLQAAGIKIKLAALITLNGGYPPEVVDELNANIVGLIEVIGKYRKQAR